MHGPRGRADVLEDAACALQIEQDAGGNQTEIELASQPCFGRWVDVDKVLRAVEGLNAIELS